MSINSKQKGKRGELQIASLFREWGYDAHRSAQYKGNTGQAPDIEGVPYIHCEVKFQERMSLYDWMEQSENDARAEGAGNLPVVIHKANNKPVLVTMTFESWIQLYNEYHAGKEIKDGKASE